MSDLLNCPFCGGSRIVVDKPALSRLYAVYCEDCEIRGPSAGSTEGAREMWNLRTPTLSGDDVGQVARELLAAEWDKVGRPELAESIRNGREDEWSKAGPALRAIARVLSATAAPRRDDVETE